jgi:hypothetical protein
MTSDNDKHWLVEVRGQNVWIHAHSCLTAASAIERARKLLKSTPVRIFEVSLGRAYVFNSVDELDAKLKDIVSE